MFLSAFDTGAGAGPESGTTGSEGVIPRAVRALFELRDSGVAQFSVRASYLEIYNEQVACL